MRKFLGITSILIAFIVASVFILDAIGGGNSEPELKKDGFRPGNVYYISNSLGSDDYNGLSQNAPWKTLEKVSSNIYEEGDQILFMGGDAWIGELVLYGSGSYEYPIKVSGYNSSNGKPVINGNGTQNSVKFKYNSTQNFSAAVRVMDGSHWIIDGLEVTNSDPGNLSYRSGIAVINDSQSKEDYNNNPKYDITIKNCYVHNVDADINEKKTGGILLFGNINEVVIDHNIVENVCSTGIRNVSWALTIYGSHRAYFLEDYKITNNTIRNIYGDGILLDAVRGALAEYNLVDNFCAGGTGYYAGIWPWACDKTIIQYNEVCNGGNVSDDGTSFDIDWYNTDTLLQYNYSHGNYQGFCMFLCVESSSGDARSTGTVVRYNISINDGRATNSCLMPYQANTETTAPLIYNNVFYQNSAISSLTLFTHWSSSSNIGPMYMRFYNNVVSSPRYDTTYGMRFAGKNLVGEVAGNIFKAPLINYNSRFNDFISANLSLSSSEQLFENEIAIDSEPSGYVSYNSPNSINTNILLNFILFNGISNPAIAISNAMLGNIPRETKDFFGNSPATQFAGISSVFR